MGILGRQPSAVAVQQLTRHSEVNQESTTAFELDNQIFAAAIQRCDSLSLELGGDSGWVEGPGETGVGDFDALQTAPHELWLEPRSDRLDLR